MLTVIMAAVLKEKYLRIVPYLDRRFLVFIYMALWYNQNIKINIANKANIPNVYFYV